MRERERENKNTTSNLREWNDKSIYICLVHCLAKVEDYINIRSELTHLFDCLLMFKGIHGWVPSHANLVIQHIKQPLLKPSVYRYLTKRLRPRSKAFQQNWEALRAGIGGHHKSLRTNLGVFLFKWRRYCGIF